MKNYIILTVCMVMLGAYCLEVRASAELERIDAKIAQAEQELDDLKTKCDNAPHIAKPFTKECYEIAGKGAELLSYKGYKKAMLKKEAILKSEAVLVK